MNFLHLAAKNGHINIVKLLIEHGADVNAKYRFGFAPLHDADSKGYIEIVKLLIKNFKNL